MGTTTYLLSPSAKDGSGRRLFSPKISALGLKGDRQGVGWLDATMGRPLGVCVNALIPERAGGSPRIEVCVGVVIEQGPQ